MDKTFPDRRKMIVEDLSPVSAVLSKYPTLCGEEQVYRSSLFLVAFFVCWLNEVLNFLDKAKIINMFTDSHYLF